MKEIKDIVEMGKRLDEMNFEIYATFAKRQDFDKALTAFWTDMARWKKSHLSHWKGIAKGFDYRNLFNRSNDDLKLIILQMKNIQSEITDFMRRLRKKRITQNEAISQTILNEFCLVSDILLEIFYTYDETCSDCSPSCVEECEVHLVRMANTLRPYLKLNPLYAVLLRSIVEMRQKYDFLLATHGKMRKAAV